MDFDRIYLDPLYATAGAPVHLLVTAVTAYLIAQFCRRLGLGRAIALWSMALFGLGSPALVYARGDFAQPLTGLCWIAALYTACCFRQTQSYRFAAWCAIAGGYAVLTRPIEGGLLLPATLALLVPGYKIARYSDRDWRALGLAMSGWGIAVIVTFFVNYARYQHWFITGYEAEGWTTPFSIGLSGLLISPGRGLIWAFPAVVLVPAGIRRLYQQGQQALVYACMGLTISLIGLMSMWHIWWGGGNWGPRLILPAVPLLAIPAAAGLASIPQRYRTLAAVVLVIAGMVWSLPGVIVDLLAGYGGFYNSTDASFGIMSYPPFGAWRFLDHWFATSLTDNRAIDILWLRLARSTTGASLVPFAGCLVIAILLLRRLYIQLAARKPSI
jgi:hypothetical protein